MLEKLLKENKREINTRKGYCLRIVDVGRHIFQFSNYQALKLLIQKCL